MSNVITKIGAITTICPGKSPICCFNIRISFVGGNIKVTITSMANVDYDTNSLVTDTTKQMQIKSIIAGCRRGPKQAHFLLKPRVK